MSFVVRLCQYLLPEGQGSMSRQPEQDALVTFEGEVERNYRWNFNVSLFEGIVFEIGMSFASLNTVLPAFARRLTSSNFLIGLIPFFSTLGWSLPQILMANFTQKLKKKKGLIILATLGERIPWFFLFLAIMLLSSSPPSILLVTFFTLFALFCFSGGIGGPAWHDMLAKVIPLKKRGRFFGLSSSLGSAMGIFGAFLSIFLLKSFSFPKNFALCFLFAFLAMCISFIGLILLREPASPVKNKESSLSEYFLRLPSLLKKDKNFSSFLIATILLSCGGMATTFFAVHAMNRLTLPDSQIGIFTLLLLAGQTISSILWGYLGDKKGYKLVMELGTLLTILSIPFAIVSTSIYLFYVVFFILGCGFSASIISSMGVVLEFSTPEMRPTYIALSNTIRAPFMSLSPLLGGFLADRVGFPPVFVITIFILLVGVLYLAFLVKEPRHVTPLLSERHMAKERL